ncbi:hypothetical protein VTJ04DRAFT_9378 [Mycothermus thermophilus]|uniref:uncharacterized protein n=1 Tax=Humicola insolens TaxID=85995 RepID=UPI003743F595
MTAWVRREMGAQGWHFDTWGIYEHGSLGAEFEGSWAGSGLVVHIYQIISGSLHIFKRFVLLMDAFPVWLRTAS